MRAPVVTCASSTIDALDQVTAWLVDAAADVAAALDHHIEWGDAVLDERDVLFSLGMCSLTLTPACAQADDEWTQQASDLLAYDLSLDDPDTPVDIDALTSALASAGVSLVPETTGGTCSAYARSLGLADYGTPERAAWLWTQRYLPAETP